MAITVSFNGATIRKPGSYSKTIIDLGGSFALSPVGVVGMIGEAPRGRPGSSEIMAANVFNAGQMAALRDKYGAGSPLADACSLAFSPSNDGAIVNGAQAIYPYKTNSSTQAQAVLEDYGVVFAREYGEDGNLCALTIDESTSALLPKLANLHYLPSSSLTGSFALSANGLGAQNPGPVPVYNGTTGDSSYLVSAISNLSDLAATGGNKSALWTNTDSTTELSASNQDGATTFILSDGVIPSEFSLVEAGDIFVISGVATPSWSGTYLCTVASAATAITAVKLKDLDSNSITLPDVDSETFSGPNAASYAFKAFDIEVLSPALSGQGASLQVEFPQNRVYGGSQKTLLSASIADVGTIKLTGSSFASVTATVTGGTWVQIPQVGDTVWILPDSQLAAGTENCGSYYVTSATASTITMTKDDGLTGTCTPVAAETISTQGVGSNLRCFARAQATPNYAAAIASQAESKRIFTIENTRDELVESSDEIGGTVVFRMGYGDGAAIAATVSINQTTKRLTTSITGVPEVNLNINLLQYSTLAALAGYINAQPGYKAEVDSTYANLSPLELDQVQGIPMLSLPTAVIAAPARIKKDKADVEALFEESSILEATVTAKRGLPDSLEKTFLTGGIAGATSAASILAALDEFEKLRINTIVPLFSRDAAYDVNEGKTNESSTYLIDSIHAAVKSHCILMSNTKNRSERHCVLAYRGSYEDAKKKAANLSSFRSQMVFQDVNALSTDGQVKWMQPHMLAALVAGMRSGAVVGLPLTFKFFNISGLRHTQSKLDEVPEDVVIDFEPRLQYDDAIDAGLTFLENPPSGGFRMVVDNTTYTKDDNWVYNRMATLHAADVVAFDFRTRLENAVIGQRNTDVNAGTIRGLCEALLTGYKNQGLLGATTEAPNGYSNLSVQLVGNTATVDVTVILVEGIDFVLSTITLKRNTGA